MFVRIAYKGINVKRGFSKTIAMQKCMLKVIIWGPTCGQKHLAGEAFLPQSPLKNFI